MSADYEQGQKKRARSDGVSGNRNPDRQHHTKTNKLASKSDADRDKFETELASEIAYPPAYEFGGDDRDDQSAEHPGLTNISIGWISLGLSLASLFILPQWLSLAGIVLGGATWLTGGRGLGLWAIIIGSISFVAYVVLLPYYS